MITRHSADLSILPTLRRADDAVDRWRESLPLPVRLRIPRWRRGLLPLIIAALCTGGAAPLMIPLALGAHLTQTRPRRLRTSLVPVLVGCVASIWGAAAFADVGVGDVADGPVLAWGALTVVALAALAYSEATVRRGHSFDPAVYGLPLGVLLGRCGGQWVSAPPQVATLVIGPPRSGKTTGVIVPNVMAWRGPVLTTTTRRDVLDSCATLRLRRGRVWCFEPVTSHDELPMGVERLHWSPVRGAVDWETAVERAASLMAGAAHGVEESNHWRARGCQLLAALLHAAAVSQRPMSAVCEWVHANRQDVAESELDEHGAPTARAVLTGIGATPERERGSIWSAVAGALSPFDMTSVIASADAAALCAFDADAWLEGENALFLVAPADRAMSLAPLVVGLVEEVRAAALRRSEREGGLHLPLLLALDEVANISPLPSLPQIVSEGGGRNIVVLAALQDLAQARQRWDRDIAEGLLTMAGAKLLLPGIADADTLDRVERLCGKHWVEQTTSTRSSTSGILGGWNSSTHYGLVEQPRFAAASIRGLSPGSALAIVGSGAPAVVELAVHHRIEPFRSWTRAVASVRHAIVSEEKA